MDMFVEYFDGDYAVCRLPDKAGNLIRLPLRDLPGELKEFDVVSMRDNGSFYIDPFAREIRMKKITQYMKYKKYCFDF
ncbi:MAG: DUF3006 domain-containing protein [Clostridia bacterium]|nr:DUF3006 domain-containing protein [Clostridia bacterium]